MTNDNYTHRRKVIAKYYNRPPFTLKMRESPFPKNKENEIVPKLKMKNKYHSLERSYRDIINQLESGSKQFKEDKSKDIIPRVIQSFQRVTPNKETYLRCRKKPLESNHTSLHTLFRNKNMPLGKHIPDHKIMKHLLQNLAEDSAEAKYFDEFADTVPIKEVNTNISVTAKTKDIRVDKSTSTTGLVWPIPEEPILDCQRLKTRIPRRQRSNQVMPERQRSNQITNKLRVNQSVVETRTRHVTSTENESEGIYDRQIAPAKDRSRNNIIPKDQYQIRRDSSENEAYPAYRTKTALQKEKSFVKAQVEKYNRINGKSPPHRKLPTHKGNVLTKEVQSCACPYAGLMNRAKKSFPKFDSYDNSTDNHQDWSDNNIAENRTPEKIMFPKETRLAVESMLDKVKPSRIPLAKFVQDNFQLRPAIELGDGEGFKTAYHSLALPCTRNLLCDRGYHEGPCDNLEAPQDALDGCYRKHKHRKCKKRDCNINK